VNHMCTNKLQIMNTIDHCDADWDDTAQFMRQLEKITYQV